MHVQEVELPQDLPRWLLHLLCVLPELSRLGKVDKNHTDA